MHAATQLNLNRTFRVAVSAPPLLALRRHRTGFHAAGLVTQRKVLERACATTQAHSGTQAWVSRPASTHHHQRGQHPPSSLVPPGNGRRSKTRFTLRARLRASCSALTVGPDDTSMPPGHFPWGATRTRARRTGCVHRLGCRPLKWNTSNTISAAALDAGTGAGAGAGVGAGAGAVAAGVAGAVAVATASNAPVASSVFSAAAVPTIDAGMPDFLKHWEHMPSVAGEPKNPHPATHSARSVGGVPRPADEAEAAAPGCCVDAAGGGGGSGGRSSSVASTGSDPHRVV